MAPQEAVHARGVRVALGVGVLVVVAVVGRPPQRTALHAGGADAGEDELHGTRGTEGAVREVAVVEAGDGEHAQHVESRGDRERPVRETPTQNTRKAGQVHRRRRARRAASRCGLKPARRGRTPALVSNQRRNVAATPRAGWVVTAHGSGAGCSSGMRISSCGVHGEIRAQA